MKRLITCAMMFTLFAFASVAANGQDYSDFDGTWFNSNFVSTLKSTASVAAAMDAVRHGEPLTIRFDSTNNDGVVPVLWRIGSQDTLLIRKTAVAGMGMTWALGTLEGPKWVVGVDVRNGTYVSLTPIAGVDTAKPIVMGRLPSKNQDPNFILKRMINSSYLTGRWKDAKGKAYSFTSGMVATVDGISFPYELTVQQSGTIRVVLTSTEGKPQSYVVARSGSTLTLQPIGNKGKTTAIVLQKAE